MKSKKETKPQANQGIKILSGFEEENEFVYGEYSLRTPDQSFALVNIMRIRNYPDLLQADIRFFGKKI